MKTTPHWSGLWIYEWSQQVGPTAWESQLGGNKWEKIYTNKIRIKRLKVNVRRFFLTRFDVLFVFRSLSFLVYLNKDWVSLHYKGLFICSRVIKRMSKEQWNNCLLSSPLDSPTTLQDLHSSLLDDPRPSKTPTLLPPRLLFGYHHDPTYTLITSSSHSSSTSHQSAL
jgi:hypothetical protein